MKRSDAMRRLRAELVRLKMSMLKGDVSSEPDGSTEWVRHDDLMRFFFPRLRGDGWTVPPEIAEEVK